MKIVVAPDSYKESLSALDVATEIEAGIKLALPDAEVVKVPVADGGEGTVQAMVDATGGRYESRTVTGPLGQPVSARFALLGDGATAVVEMAEASGLHLVTPDQRDPRVTTTFGTGELILAALDMGVTHLILGLGGSATNDGGAGMVQALGARLLDATGTPLPPGGAALAQLASIDIRDLDHRLGQLTVEVACDVDNPLCGAKGASAVFGPQKGASDDVVAELDAALAHYAECLLHQLGQDVAAVPGAGAAGGMGAAALAFLGATLRPGIEIVLDTVGLDEQLVGADLVITGEGRIDSQTIHGKTPMGVAKRAKALDIPVIGLAGSLSDDVDVVHAHGIDAVFSVLPRPLTLEEALVNARPFLRQAARNVAALYMLRR
ncbi:glycerate kinase [Ferrimonas balearica]|uniref:glycerate kinase n=1 Tax=Ferrimonas balearica TaxID=44012 RepID=UPI001C999362|nr:glycerate kinase [Ferrimonas balearica]MBY5921002.1 glycerate kinase [Ferrimonas balearica]MBY5996313.1 glycerate kinase [Ferrimonas balearica]